MSTLVNSLKGRISFLEQENETLARAVDNVSAAYSTALERLRQHEPEFVADVLGTNRPAAQLPNEAA